MTVSPIELAGRAWLVRRGFVLEYATLGWNLVGIVVLAWSAWAARSVALAGFGLDSLIEVGASIVVVWELSGTGQGRQHRALRLIGAAFVGLAIYLLVQSSVVLAAGITRTTASPGLCGPLSPRLRCSSWRPARPAPVGH